MGSWELLGADDLIGDLEAMIDAVGPKGTREALEDGAEPILRQMEANAPVKKNVLKESIKKGKVKVSGVSSHITIGVHKGTGGANHAHLVEHGHGGPHPAPPHPFMRPAFDASDDEAYVDATELAKEDDDLKARKGFFVEKG